MGDKANKAGTKWRVGIGLGPLEQRKGPCGTWRELVLNRVILTILAVISTCGGSIGPPGLAVLTAVPMATVLHAALHVGGCTLLVWGEEISRALALVCIHVELMALASMPNWWRSKAQADIIRFFSGCDHLARAHRSPAVHT